jgi:hypothetical protein
MPTDSAPRADESQASSGPKSRPEYRAAREAFEKLEPADKAAFLLESAFGSAGEMVAEAARAVSDVVERAGQSEFWCRPTEEGAPGDPAAPRSRKRGPSGPAPGAPPDTSWGSPGGDKPGDA